ncbi:hypothetical protein EVG20_g1612 [Dentipellis fragilis]|uniref:Uncharacterized protein n=1 Tax=Dentipellis fragilis TaxID=205917 RepID=A0A4Y9ZAC0_9AGAM|nr:hypothetical protein EVG20_g1612 [Dentipellis fragilis]
MYPVGVFSRIDPGPGQPGSGGGLYGWRPRGRPAFSEAAGVGRDDQCGAADRRRAGRESLCDAFSRGYDIGSVGLRFVSVAER